MNVEDLIERAVLSMRSEMGYTLTRADRNRLEHLNSYFAWHEGLASDQDELQLRLWDSD